MKTKNMTHHAARLILIAAVALTSCAKDDNTGIDDNGNSTGPGDSGSTPGAVLLVTETRLNGELTSRMEYNNNNQLTTIIGYINGVHASTSEHVYDNLGRIAKVVTDVTGQNILTSEEYTYEGNSEKPVSAASVVSYPDMTVTSDTYFTYAENQMTEIVISSLPIPEVEFVYTYGDNGELLTQKTSEDGVWVSTVEFGDYDDKNSPAMTGNAFEWRTPARHNHRSMKTTSPDGVTEDRIYRYTYNDAGYPVKTEVSNRGEEKVLLTFEYTYKKAN